MIDENTELKAGGKVRISGAWHEVADLGGEICANLGATHIMLTALMPVIEAYEPPIPKAEPYEWITDHELILMSKVEDLSKHLTKAYGDPTIHTYANEAAILFGITGNTDVLVWAGGDHIGRWDQSEFRHLEEGDWWRLQPAAPRGVKS